MTELRDFRCRITPETDAVPEAISRAQGRDKQETAREVLHRWAEEQIHVATLTCRLLPDKGSEGTGRA
jgi:hypothetical protein